jgi:uncharacterized protein (TIGR02231 family)
MIAALAVLLAAEAAPAAPPAPAPPLEVVVYPDRARITRQLEVPCAARALVEFGEVTPAADPASFRAAISVGTIDGVRWQERARPTAFAARADGLDRTLRELDGQVAALDQRLQRTEKASETREALLAVAERLVTEQMGRGRPHLPTWSAALEVVLRAGLDAEQTRASAEAQRRDLVRRRTALRAERAALEHGTQQSAHLVEVIATCPAGRKARVRLSYLVGGAGWTPTYEARERGGQVELATFATVRQTTGEDWQAARLTLSTATPRQDATPPELAPLTVYAEERAHDEPAIVARSEETPSAPGVAAGAPAGTGTRLQAAPQGLSVQLAVPDPAQVPGDGRQVRLLVARSRGKARLRLVAVPRLAAHVFRVAELTNAAPFPLLPGPVDVYRGGDFLCRDRLTGTPSGGRFSVGFGIEDGVEVRRRVLEESDRPAGLLGGTRHHRFSYRFEVQSRLAGPVDLDLLDQVPVSELAEVAVVLDPRTTAGHRLDRRDGHIAWALSLAPGVDRRVELAFRVEVPSKYH